MLDSSTIILYGRGHSSKVTTTKLRRQQKKQLEVSHVSVSNIEREDNGVGRKEDVHAMVENLDIHGIVHESFDGIKVCVDLIKDYQLNYTRSIGDTRKIKEINIVGCGEILHQSVGVDGCECSICIGDQVMYVMDNQPNLIQMNHFKLDNEDGIVLRIDQANTNIMQMKST